MGLQGQVLADVRKMLDEFGADSAYKALVGKEGDAAVRRLLDKQEFHLVCFFPVPTANF